MFQFEMFFSTSVGCLAIHNSSKSNKLEAKYIGIKQVIKFRICSNELDI